MKSKVDRGRDGMGGEGRGREVLIKASKKVFTRGHTFEALEPVYVGEDIPIKSSSEKNGSK